MHMHYLVENGEILARGVRTELAPLETSNRHVVFAPDWDLGITWLQDPEGKRVDALQAAELRNIGILS